MATASMMKAGRTTGLAQAGRGHSLPVQEVLTNCAPAKTPCHCFKPWRIQPAQVECSPNKSGTDHRSRSAGSGQGARQGRP
ncbi:hypothetical protein WDZ92_51225, partial [Nostoc sp. NIES-2111]